MEKFIRKLARSYDWQFLYARAKELNNIKIFKNNSNFTKLQLLFLRWLEIYHSLYIDLDMEKDYISKDVIEDDLRTEAYLLYRHEIKKGKNKKRDKEEQTKNINQLPTVVFTKE